MRKSIYAFIFGALLLPDAGFTLGMGEIEVNSALNQELDADIALLSASAADAEQLIVKLASSEEFSRAGIDRPYMLTSLRFKVIEKDGQPYIKVKSPKPIREPFLNFLVEVDWPQGHLLREYTILLDPPVFMGAEPTAAPRPAAADSRPTAAPSTAAPAQSDSGRYAPAPVAAAPAQRETSQSTQTSAPLPVTPPRTNYAPPGGYRIQAGDTAWSLANSMRPDESVSVEQMMLAMLRSNPEVFINGNVNGLKRGYILRTPDYETINSVDHAEAVAMVREQNALWREYQQALASGMPASSMESASTGGGSASMETSDDARLNIVSAGTGAGMSSGSKDPTAMSPSELRAELARTNEQLESERLEKEALNGKVQDLEGQVDKMKSLLTIEDQQMSEMQENASEEITAEDLAKMDKAMAPQPAGEAPAEVAEGATTESAEGEVTEASAETTQEQQPEQAGESGQQAVFMDEKPAETEAAAQAEEQPLQAKSGSDNFMDTLPKDFVTPPKPDPMTVIMGNPIILGVIAVGFLLLIGIVFFIIKKRRSAAADAPVAAAAEPAKSVEDELDDIADIADIDDEVEASADEAADDDIADIAEEESFDSDSTMILPSADDTIVTPSADEAPEEDEERDDVIAEADVYLAYGIYQQAEELLENAIGENPERDAYRVKLAETHYAGKNADAFVKTATGLKEQSGTGTKAWAKVAAMGKDLVPDNDMFDAADAAGGVDLGDIAPKAPEMDFDLESEGSEEAASPDLDFSLDDDSAESPLEVPDTEDETAILDLDDLGADDSSTTDGDDELEFDLSETDAVEPAAEESEEEALDISADELDLDMGLDTEESSDDSAAEEIDLGLDLSEEADASGDAEIDLDLDMGTDSTEEAATDDIELDLGLDMTNAEVPAAEEPAVEEPAAEEPAASSDLDLDADLGDLGDVDEVATKLDLARAYLDMGDNDGTRSILEEVLTEGNDDQKKEAQELLDQLG